MSRHPGQRVLDRFSDAYRGACLSAGLDLAASVVDPGSGARNSVWTGDAWRALRLVAWGGGDVESAALDLGGRLHRGREAQNSARKARAATDPPTLPDDAFRDFLVGQSVPLRRSNTVHRRPAPAPAERYVRPPWGEIADLLRRCVPATRSREVAGWLSKRGLPLLLVSQRLSAYALPHDLVDTPSWAASRRGPWARTGFRLLLPVYDCDGHPRSVISRSVRGGKVKALPPTGSRRKALVLANHAAVDALGSRNCPHPVIVVEGEPDFLTIAAALPDWPVVGVAQGSWTGAFAARFPLADSWHIATHGDQDGDKYAATIRATLPADTDVYRLRVSQLYAAREQSPPPKADWNDALRDELFDVTDPDSVIAALDAAASRFPRGNGGR